jgi:hypothetical protein
VQPHDPNVILPETMSPDAVLESSLYIRHPALASAFTISITLAVVALQLGVYGCIGFPYLR